MCECVYQLKDKINVYMLAINRIFDKFRLKAKIVTII